MLKPGPARKLIVTVNEADRWHGRSVYNALLQLFQRKGLAGATVSRAIAGFTGRGAIQTVNLVDLSAAMPVRIEVVDAAEAIDRVLPDVYDIVERGLVEIQETEVIKLATGKSDRSPEKGQDALMRLIGKAKMLNIHIGADDKWEGEPLHEAIVKRARQLDIAGATVYRGVLGYGAHRRLHKHKAFALSQDEPIMVAVIDTQEHVDKLLAAIDSMISVGCMIAVSDVTVVRYEQPAGNCADTAQAAANAGQPDA
jgi:PII-like signaling protein